ncbi:uncharacterized protein [Bactrocera oleae]|uniref:uncharacterized protein n=1 Tax=Bactrocera oleae TaxID=104688 RepID=UPI00387E3F54
MVSNFWQMEEIAVVDDLPENECGHIFETTHSRTSDGRYIIHLPLRRKATHNEVPRGVQRFGTYQHWNLIERYSTGRSNTSGFTEYRVAITADIEKMFRQVLVASEHRDYQRIIWRESAENEIRVYRLKTITYGMACSPYKAVRTLQQCTCDNPAVIPDIQQATRARTAILTSFYVDDFLTSCESVSEAVELAKNVDAILSAGQCTLRKWHSNDSQVMMRLSNEPSLSSYIFYSGEASILGLRSDALKDQLPFRVDLCQGVEIPTKRCVLSEVVRFFDPIGLLSPVIFSGHQLHANIVVDRFRKFNVAITADVKKIFRQILIDTRHRKWQRSRESPDEPLQVYELKTVTYGMACSPFNAIRALRQCANDNYKVIYDPSRAAAARHSILYNFYVDDYLDSVDSDELSATRAQDVATVLKQGQLILGKWNSNSTHVLSTITGTTVSASELDKAYAAVVYVQTIDNSRTSRTVLVSAKSKIAPIKDVTIPRLELCGVHLLTKTLVDGIHRGVGCTMSLPALTEEEEQLSIAESRPVSIFVSRADYQWIMTSTKDKRIPLLEKFSKLSRLLNTTVWLRRWLPKYRGYRNDVVSLEEQRWALLLHVRQAQGNHFKHETKSLALHSRIVGRSQIIALNPFLDTDGILSVSQFEPLIALYDDPKGGIALTPGGFLIGRPLNCRPDPPLPEAPENRLRYWQQLQKMLKHFWRRWQSEYLQTLQTRNKWTRAEPNVQRGDIVLIRGENLPPSVWRMGRVIDVHPGSDGLVRTVTIEYNANQRSSDGIPIKQRCQRPVQKLCRLTGPAEELLNREGSAGQDVQDLSTLECSPVHN